MTNNLPINNQVQVPNIQPYQPAVSTSETSGASNSTTQQVPRVDSLRDLKRAELKGDYYSVSDEQLVRAIEHAIKAMEGRTTQLSFSIHEETKLINVKVLDKETGEVIREVPPEKMLDFVANLWKMAGIIIDEKR